METLRLHRHQQIPCLFDIFSLLRDGGVGGAKSEPQRLICYYGLCKSDVMAKAEAVQRGRCKR